MRAPLFRANMAFQVAELNEALDELEAETRRCCCARENGVLGRVLATSKIRIY